MEATLTLNIINALPEEILRIANENNAYSELLQKEMYTDHDFVKIKRDIEKLFKRFNNIKYTHKLPKSYDTQITTNYKPRLEAFMPVKIDKTGNQASKIVDDEIWALNFINTSLYLATKLTTKEAKYFIDAFFSHLSEITISEKLEMHINTLKNTVKKSCLIKAWIEFETLNEL